MRDVASLLSDLSGRPERSASVTVVAMLMAGLLAKVDSARWALIAIVVLCIIQIVLGLIPATEALSPPPQTGGGE